MESVAGRVFPAKIKVVIGAAVAYMLLVLFQVATHREDWPLSCYPMYSTVAPSVATRSVLVGVSDEGEFRLNAAQTSPFTGARLRVVIGRLKSRPARFKSFATRISDAYESRREAAHWPVLQGIRAYTEEWKIRPGLAGIRHPHRELDVALYVPPHSLSARLRAESRGHATPEGPVPVAPGEVVVDLGADDCGENCAAIEDKYASNGASIALSGKRKRSGALETDVSLDAGEWFVFARLKSTEQFPGDSVLLALDGGKERIALGNYKDVVSEEAWVWESQAPGARAVSVQVSGGRQHLRLESEGRVLIDQLWFSRTRAELPVDNAPRRP